MKAMVLAAGLGTRMRPLTGLLAKPALPVLNRPLLALDARAPARARRARRRRQHCTTCPRSVERRVGDGRRFGLRVRYSHEPSLLGSGGGPRAVREFFGDEPFLLVNGDMRVRLRPRAALAAPLELGGARDARAAAATATSRAIGRS